jgi:hypothetical protein
MGDELDELAAELLPTIAPEDYHRWLSVWPFEGWRMAAAWAAVFYWLPYNHEMRGAARAWIERWGRVQSRRGLDELRESRMCEFISWVEVKRALECRDAYRARVRKPTN